MSQAGRDVLVGLLLLFAVILFARAPRSPRGLGPPSDVPLCEVPIERVGVGVACIPREQARSLGWEAGDRIEADGRRGRMAASRLELFAVPIEINEAPSAELESISGIGPGLAGRIVAGRPYAAVDEIAKIPGLGRKRFQGLRPRLWLRPRSP